MNKASELITKMFGDSDLNSIRNVAANAAAEHGPEAALTYLLGVYDAFAVVDAYSDMFHDSRELVIKICKSVKELTVPR